MAREEDVLKKHFELSKQGCEALRKIVDFSCSFCGLCVAVCPSKQI